jgi:hypothetical protein
MPNKQTILWTALPNGRSDDGRSLRLSLLASPRLETDPDTTLAAFPDFVDWPATLAQSRFRILFGASGSVAVAGNDFAGATRIDDRLGIADSDVWKALLPRTTLVHGYAFRDLSNHAVLSFPAAAMDDLVRDLYSRLAVSATDQLPAPAAILGDPAWGALLNAVANNDERSVDQRTGVRDPSRQFEQFKGDWKSNKNHAATTLEKKLARFQLFHTPASKQKIESYAHPADEAQASARWLGYEQKALPDRRDFQTTIDFHQIVTAMNQYPTLLRKLGLVVDLLIARDAFTPAPNELLAVEVELPPSTPEVTRGDDPSPHTRTLLDSRLFQPVSSGRPQPDLRVENGLLDLDPNAFRVLQADVDGGGLKVMNFARSLLTLRNNPDYQQDPVTQQEREIGAPALRNAGLMLVHDQRADMLAESIKRQSKFVDQSQKIRSGAADPATLEMRTEDLVRGYRVDIWDDVSRQWHSLCQRRAAYDVDGEVAINVPQEEGTVQLAATTSPDPTSNPDIVWLHEALVTWAGWSLCAPPPGKTIGHDAKAGHSDPVTDAAAEVPPGLRLRSTFQALRGSLPRLRYGRKYWLRARAVDLAGNSLPLSPRDFGPEQPEQRAVSYLRYEPISAPAIALVRRGGAIEAPAEGESMERIAVRSFNDKPSLNTVPTPQRARRFAVPSRTTQREAEQHGLLDRDGVVDPSFFAMLATKDFSLPEEKLPSAGPPDGSSVETKYSVMDEGQSLPYLPEPLAVEIRARLFDHPDFPSMSIRIPLYEATRWPDALPFKIEIYEDSADKPHFDSDQRTLFVPLPKAARVTLRLSVKPAREALQLLGVWNWLTPAQRNQKVTVDGKPITLQELALRGQHWMLTPWRNLELVHAVQRPLITPKLQELDIQRGYDATFALPTFLTPCSIASTEHLDLRAAWNDPFDDPAADVVENHRKIDRAFAVKITTERAYAGKPEYRLMKPDLILAGGRFNDRINPKVHEFHDTRYRRIEYWLEATTKFREFMPSSVLTDSSSGTPEPSDEKIKVVGDRRRTWIPSSAPPPAPDVLYVVPTFGWVRSRSETSRSSWRRGGGLRVYLDRPWNASGYGEMLAVVLPPADFSGDPNDAPAAQPLKNFVTQWGNDPVWLSPFVPSAAPKQSNFPLARTAPDPDGKWLPTWAPAEEADQPPGKFKTTKLSHPELGTPKGVVDIAPHDVFFDAERRLWYCDIEVTWGASYFPFIRLALARYQPVSLPDVELSHIVLADFMQLVPDRWLNVTQTRDPRTSRVQVYGNTFSNSRSHVEESDFVLPDGSIGPGITPPIAPSSVIEVTVERFDPAIGEDFGWRREPDAVVQRDVRKPASAIAVRAGTAKRADDLVRNREFNALLEESLIERAFAPPVLWEGTVTLPHADDSARYRLVIAEYEEHLIDGADIINAPPRKGRRLVFVEHVALGSQK